MPITLTDEQVAQFRAELEAGRRAKNVEDMVNGIWNDPALTNEAKALFKKKYPDVPIPDYDVERKVEQRFAERDKKEADAKKKEREAAQDEDFKSRRKRTQDDYGFTDDAMGRLEKLMNERGIGDYEVAAEYFAAREPKPSDARDAHGPRWGFQDDKAFDEIAKDPEKWAHSQILQAARTDQQREKQQR
jgi:hypothetical protein